MMRRGQVMILAVLAIGGTVLGATTIAGLLMLFQVRQVSDLANSAKAVFAADAGIEWALYLKLKDASFPFPSFANGAELAVKCFDKQNKEIECSDASTVLIKALGTSGNSSRLFFERFVSE